MSRMEEIIETVPMGGDLAFPVMRNLWDFFSRKGSKAVCVSVGVSAVPTLELHLSENIGCKLHIFDPDTSKLTLWQEVQTVLKTRKSSEETSEFAKLALKKWVLPNNLFTYSYIPAFQTGSENLKSTMEAICQPLGETRIDILKITISDQTAAMLYAMLHYGYRPGLIFVSWNTSPDTTVENTLLAGHLQMTGYALVDTRGNNYLYYFNDKNMYEVCSWQSNKTENPLVAKIMESASLKKPTQE